MHGDAQYAAPFVEAHVREWRLLAHRRIDDEHVDTAEALDGAVDHHVNGIPVRDISDERFRLTAAGFDLLHYLVASLVRRAN